MHKILALDYGGKYIGLAIADTVHRIAFPKGKIRNTSLEETLQALELVILREQVDLLVLGLPKGMRGTMTRQEETIHLFLRELQNKFNVPVKLWDERLTTKIALSKLQHAGKNTRGQRQLKDELAAQLILESYLEGQEHTSHGAKEN